MPARPRPGALPWIAPSAAPIRVRSSSRSDNLMDRRRFLRGVVMAGAGAFAAPMLNLGRCRVFADDGAPGGGPLRSVRAVDLMGEAAVIDMLGLRTLDWPRLARWQREPGSFGEANFARLRASGVDVFHPAVEPNQPDATAAVRRGLGGRGHLR